MIENILNKIIESIVLLHPPSVELGNPDRDIDTVTILFEEMLLLTSIFADILPEEVKSFGAAVSDQVTDYLRPDIAIEEKNEKETKIIALFERNTNSVAYLNFLNKILIDKKYDTNILEELNRPYNFQMPYDQVYSSRDHYLEKFAESYAQGITSGSIQYLLKTSNSIFLEHSGFIADLKEAITITERERLKKKMELSDDLDTLDLSESEIKAAVTQSERERLKQVMRKLDADEENKEKLISNNSSLISSEDSNKTATIIPFDKRKINWKRYAAAAIVIGIIATTAVIVYNNRNPSSVIVRNKPDASDTTKKIPGKDQNIIDVLASNKWDSAYIVLTVKKEGAMGFAVKPEKNTAKIHRLKENISGLPEVVKQIDSLKKMNKTYTFENNNLSVYLINDDLPVLYKIENKYYLKIADTLYHIGPSDKPAMLKKVTDKNILTRIDKINYTQGNK